MNKHVAIGLILTLAVGLMSGCSKPVQTEAMKIGSMPTQTASIYAVGIDKGIFKKHQVDLNLTIFKSAIERDAAATGGQLDGFLTDIMGEVNLKAHKFDFKIASTEYENFCLMVNEKSQAATTLKVGVANNTVTEYIADVLPSGKTIEKVNVPKVPERLASVMSNTLNAGIFPEPFVSILKAKKATPATSSADAGLQPVVFVFSDAYLKDHSDAVKRFYEAYNETVQYMKDNDYSTYKDVLVKNGIVTEELVDKIKLPLDHYENAKAVKSDDLKSVQDWMIGKKMIPNAYKDEELTATGLF